MSTTASAAGTSAFDYVIVGGGSAGCVLAARLSQDPAVSVCLIEAGPPDRHPLIKVPVGLAALFKHPKLNWRFETVPQPGAANRSIYIPRGKTLGGSSSINSMVYTRGHPSDYDDWARLGASGWSFREVLPYFRRSENNETWRNSPYHGTDGPLSVSDVPLADVLCQTFMEAAQMRGINACDNFCGATHEGYGLRQLTQKNGQRHSAAHAYLRPAMGRPNLSVLTNRHVDRVLFDGTRAIGVLLQGGNGSVTARREVILSAGAIASPLLLMRSGIGPGAELKKHGIAVLHAAEGVGGNLQDHISVTIAHTDPKRMSMGISLRTIPTLIKHTVQYAFRRTGLLASNPFQLGAYVKSDPSQPRPDLNYIFVPYNRSADGKLGRGHGYSLTILLLRPESRGTVRLSSPSADAPPLIDLGFLSRENDLSLLRTGIRMARSVLGAAAFDPYRGEETRPGSRVESDGELNEFIRATCATAFHPVGTCRMGSDTLAVVDAQLRVRGVEALRVVDASVMPTLMGGNPNGPTMMIAEKAADIILGRPALAPEAVV
jgi:choline dehydrogenase